MQHLVLYTVCIAIFMSLHGPAGACIPVASGSPIHVPPQYNVYLSIVVCTYIYYIYYIYIHPCDPKQS